MSDHHDIGQVLIRYATAVDTRDWELFRTCFTVDATADYGDIGRWDSVDGLVEFMVQAHLGFGDSAHMITNVAASVDGDRATARAHVQAVLTGLVSPNEWIETIGHYDDRLVRTPDGWRIEQRTYRTIRTLAGR